MMNDPEYFYINEELIKKIYGKEPVIIEDQYEC